MERNLTLLGGNRLNKSMMQHRSNRRLILVLFAVIPIVQATQASISIENVDMELARLGTSNEPKLANLTSIVASSPPTIFTPVNTNLTSANSSRFDPILTSEAVNRAPIYQSAPKQIDSPLEVSKSVGGNQKVDLEQQISPGNGGQRGVVSEDLTTAAGHHKKKKHHHKKKKKIIVVKKKKKKKRKKKKKKKIIVVKKKKKKHHKKHHHKKHHHKKHKKKKKVIYYKPKHSHRIEHTHHYEPKKHIEESVAQHHHEPAYNHHHEHHHHHEPAAAGKYYEYRSVPKKGAWEFGFKRGNMKHHIERKEHGHKSHFKTIFNWQDKKGNGKHLFDYNHGGHHKHAYGAAATQEAPKKLEAVVLVSKGKSA